MRHLVFDLDYNSTATESVVQTMDAGVFYHFVVHDKGLWIGKRSKSKKNTDTGYSRNDILDKKQYYRAINSRSQQQFFIAVITVSAQFNIHKHPSLRFKNIRNLHS